MVWVCRVQRTSLVEKTFRTYAHISVPQFCHGCWFQLPIQIYWLLPPFLLFTLAYGSIIVPKINLKNGVRVGYKDFKFSAQFTHLSEQYSDATNASDGGVSAVIGTIPAYSIIDLSASFDYKRFRIEGNVNNAANQMYFTRRATGYPGPGIIPSDGRSFFLTLQIKVDHGQERICNEKF